MAFFTSHGPWLCRRRKYGSVRGRNVDRVEEINLKKNIKLEKERENEDEKSKNMLIVILLAVFTLVIIVFFSILGGFHDRKTVQFSTKHQAAEYIEKGWIPGNIPENAKI